MTKEKKYKSVRQVVEVDKMSGEGKKVYPVTPIQAVYDARTGASLEAILAQFNNVFLQYQGSAAATRCLLPMELRRVGITISYRTLADAVVTERCMNDVQRDNEYWGLDVNWARVDGQVVLSGELSVSEHGTWVVNGEDTGIVAQGAKGDNGLTPWLKFENNKLYGSYDKVKWDELSGLLATELRIKGYVSSYSALPSSAIQGDIWGVGPTNADTNPTYRYYVRNAGGWVDNGEFTSIAAGIVQETGDGEGVVMSQKAVTEKIRAVEAEVSKANGKSYSYETLINSNGGQFKWEIPIVIPSGVTVDFIAFGLNNVVASGLVNLYLYNKNGEIAIQDTISQKKSIYITDDIVKVTLQRGTTIGNGNISLNINIKSLLDERIKQVKGYSETAIMSQKAVTDIVDEIFGKSTETEITNINWLNGYYASYSLIPTGNGWASQKIDVSKYIGKTIRVYRNVQSETARYTYITNSNGDIIGNYAEGYYNNKADNGIFYGDIDIPSDADGLYISMVSTATEKIICVVETERGLLSQSAQSPIYVNPTIGNDENDGSINAPVKSINKAIDLGNNIVLRGGIYKESVILDNCKYKNIAILGYPSEKVIAFPLVKNIVNDGSEELVSGYTKVYRVPLTENPLNGLTRGRLYQDYVADNNTLITDIDRHPLQRGLEYRCDSTLINQCASIAEIEALENSYGYYYSDGYIYFSRPKQSSANNPIIAPVIGQSFIKLSKDRGVKNQLSVYIDNIEVRYANIHISYTSSVNISNVRVKYPIVNDGGGFYMYDVVNFELNKCEVCGVTDGKTYGDGFNMHTSASDTDTEVFLQGRMVDCWAHDNFDDGYSDHENSEMTIDGGLFEFNGKGGITPSYGANDVILNAVSRYNDNGSVSNGIYVTGNPTSKRKATIAVAKNCICYGNKFAFRSQHDGCVLTLVNCIAYDSEWGTFRADSGKIYAIGCKQGGEYSVNGNISKMSLTDL